jgi:DNA-binding NarL/FixJ family response regulator
VACKEHIQAIRKLAVDKPDIVLMDIELPGMDGIEGTRKIRQQLPDCIVLIITVYEESEKVFNSFCAGAVGYIVKNTDMENLVLPLMKRSAAAHQ